MFVIQVHARGLPFFCNSPIACLDVFTILRSKSIQLIIHMICCVKTGSGVRSNSIASDVITNPVQK